MYTRDCFHFFKNDISTIALPKKFTYPFYYETHPLCELAAKEVQNYITSQTDWVHPFTKNNLRNEKPIGKMFGVLIVKNQQNKIGFISAFSGKLAGINNHTYFVPPVFDMLTNNSHFLKQEILLNNINAEIENIENHTDYCIYKTQLAETIGKATTEIADLRAFMIEAKKIRKQERIKAQRTLATKEYEQLVETLAKKSVAAKFKLRNLTLAFEHQITELQTKVAYFEQQIKNLKTKRKQKSNALQHYLFQQYQFLNSAGDTKDLLDIFKNTPFETPPAGAGECAAPKLLQYAFVNQLTPICMAEFWWGDGPKSEIRKHGNYYPACQGKCKPILGHMLKGIELDENPLLKNPAIGKVITTVFEDDYLLVINKPAEFLSVPGKTIDDSVYLRIKKQYPNATGPLIVHRLDMSTSGVMVIAKTKDIHQQLQRQFIKRQVSKRYVALLDGIPEKQECFIDLPLRLDIDDRPRQLVCFKHGKSSRTKWEIIEHKNGKTRVYFYPITGRTHQLRVHASHQLGLNTPIVGDDLYGSKQNRLHLHAESITFKHPITKKDIHIQVAAEF